MRVAEPTYQLPAECALQALCAPESHGTLSVSAVPFECEQYWLPMAATLSLVALVARDHTGRAWVSIVTPDEFESLEDFGHLTLEALQASLASLRRPLLNFADPIPLVPVAIPKPWGQEIWFTGVEARGQASVGYTDCTVPLPWLIAAFPFVLTGAKIRDLVLLKILDPVADEVRGDLYLELHEEKREVYVVTHISPAAWPNGKGAIRYGACPKKVAALGGEGQYKQSFLKAIQEYEVVRREIDALIETSADAICVPVSLIERERLLREEMNSFTALKQLSVGDVVKVPLNFPHSLQHGVRTVEFQTPVYERRILSFAQKVLTQSHWDSEYAIARMEMDEPRSEIDVLCSGTWGREERIVSFPDFEVRRLALAPGAQFSIAHPRYALAMGILGQPQVGGVTLHPETAVLLPAAHVSTRVHNPGETTATFLIAHPIHD